MLKSVRKLLNVHGIAMTLLVCLMPLSTERVLAVAEAGVIVIGNVGNPVWNVPEIQEI
jgi:hypothetical protein